MFKTPTTDIKNGIGLPIRKSTSITAPDDWIIEHIAEERSDLHRYSLCPNDGMSSQLQKARDVPDAKGRSINGIGNQNTKSLRIEIFGGTSTQDLWKQPRLGTFAGKEEEAPVSLDSLLSDSAPKSKLPEFSSVASQAVADSEA